MADLERARVVEEIRYGSGRLAAAPGDDVLIQRGVTTVFVHDLDESLIYTTDDEDWLWLHLVMEAAR